MILYGQRIGVMDNILYSVNDVLHGVNYAIFRNSVIFSPTLWKDYHITINIDNFLRVYNK